MRHVTRRMNRSSGIGQTIFTVVLVLLFLAIVAVAGAFVYDRLYQFARASTMLPNITITEVPVGTPEVVYEPGKLPRWEGTERVNILVMGIDQREHEQGPWRTDTMIVLTIDPVTKQAGMLSIPRDLWVPIADYNEQARINQAHFLGEVYGYPGGGPALAVKTVQWNIGVPIHHYARINFPAFEKLVDTIGGIDVCVDDEVVDATYPDEAYGYDPLYIPAGCQHFDGKMALKYARTRHSPGGDFDRAKRQQQVMRAVFDQVTRLDLLPQLAPRAPELWNALQGSVLTDMTLDEIIALAQLADEVDPANIRTGVIDEHYTQFWTTPDGQQVLVPLRDRIRELRDHIFTNEPPLPTGSDDPQARLAAEAATIEVLNGTTTVGLASHTTEYLQHQGLQIGRTDNADHAGYVDSLIIVYTGKNYTANYLLNLLGLPQTAVIYGDDPNAEYDITVILGADFWLPDQ